MIPGIGSAIGGAAGAVGGMVGGQPQQGGGGIGGAIGGLMGAFGGGQPQQASPMPTGATAASLMGAQPQPTMQGAGMSAANQAAHNGFADELQRRREAALAAQSQGNRWGAR